MFWKNNLALKIAFPILASTIFMLALGASLLSSDVQQALVGTADFKTVAAVGLFICAALSATSIWLAFHTARRLRRVVTATENVGQGDFSVEFSLHASDEIGRLQAALQETVSYLRGMANVADRLADGDLSVSVEVRSEKDRFGITLRNMIDNLIRLGQSKDERDRMQNAIMKLLEEVSDVAEGDLTAQAEVTADATGAIADAFNYMIDELRNIIRQVQEATQRVGMSAEEIRSTTEKLEEGSETQAKQILVTSSAIEEITASIQEVSNNAALSTEVAGQSLENAVNGARAVQNNIQAMGRIRNQVQETAKRIKRLGERSQEIGEIVRLIDELADRTSILALNASLQAAAAGEQGRGFATVAEEVERLAERSAEAVQQIANLTKTIQLETKETVASMEETIREVVDGSQLANEAGAALSEIERVSEQLAELTATISLAARKQASSSADITRSMTGISSVTELVAAESKQAATYVRRLISLTDKLNGSVSAFKLPEVKAGEVSVFDKTGSLSSIPMPVNGKEHFLN